MQQLTHFSFLINPRLKFASKFSNIFIVQYTVIIQYFRERKGAIEKKCNVGLIIGYCNFKDCYGFCTIDNCIFLKFRKNWLKKALAFQLTMTHYFSSLLRLIFQDHCGSFVASIYIYLTKSELLQIFKPELGFERFSYQYLSPR